LGPDFLFDVTGIGQVVLLEAKHFLIYKIRIGNKQEKVRT